MKGVSCSAGSGAGSPGAGRQVRLCDRRDRSEAPLLVAGSGKADRRELRRRGPADRLQPLRALGNGRAGPELEILHHGLAHAPAPEAAVAAASTHSYPLASSSSARSFPPDIAIRPFESTCTKSGTM